MRIVLLFITFQDSLNTQHVAMDLVRLLLEVFGLVFPAALTFAVQKAVPIAPLRPPLVPFQPSPEQQTLLLCALPSCAYAAGRLYFALVFGATSKIFARVSSSNSEAEPQSAVSRVISQSRSLLEFVLTGAIFVVPFFHPLVRGYLVSSYETRLAQTVSVLLELSQPEIDKAWAFAQKFVALLGGWFALLFAVELALRVLLLLVAYSLRGALSLFGAKNANREESQQTSGEETVSEDVDKNKSE